MIFVNTYISDEAFKPVNPVTSACSSTLNTPSVSLCPSPVDNVLKKGFRSRDSSVSELLPVIQGSVNSGASLDSSKFIMCFKNILQ